MFKEWLNLQEGHLTPKVTNAILEIIQNIPKIDGEEIQRQLTAKGIKIPLSIIIGKLNVFKMWSSDRKLMDTLINLKSMTTTTAVISQLKELGWRATSTWPIETLFKLSSLPEEKFHSYHPPETKKRYFNPTPKIAPNPTSNPIPYKDDDDYTPNPIPYKDDDDDYTPIQPRFGSGGGKRVIKSTRYL